MKKLLLSGLVGLAMATTAQAEETTIRVHYGIPTIWSDAQSKLAEAFAIKDRLVFIDISVDPEEHVYPMAIRGGAMSEMFLSKTERT